MLTSDTPVIEADTPCRRCGYSLRGLGAASACPECGLAAAASVGPRVLLRCDRAWVGRTAAALRGIVMGTVVYFAANLAWALLSALPLPMAWIVSMYYVMLVAETAIVLWLARAHWRFAERPPDDVATSGWAGLYRAAVVVVAVVKLVTMALLVVPVANRLVFLVQWVSHAGLLAGTGAFWFLLRDLARRVPSDRWARTAGVLMWGNTGALGVFIAAGAALFLREHFGWDWGFRVGGGNFFARLYPELPIGVVAGVAVVITGVAGLVLVHRMAKALAGRAAEARSAAGAVPA